MKGRSLNIIKDFKILLESSLINETTLSCFNSSLNKNIQCRKSENNICVIFQENKKSNIIASSNSVILIY